jgi:Protein of unknown function (DUF4231)
VSEETPLNPTLRRLDEQIAWYGRESRRNRTWYKSLKGVTIIAALLVAPIATSGLGNHIAAALGIAIAIAEALQQLNRYHENWIAYRATAEALKHEKYLHLGTAGPYSSAEHPLSLLAERMEGLISQENQKWVSYQEKSAGKGNPPSA